MSPIETSANDDPHRRLEEEDGEPGDGRDVGDEGRRHEPLAHELPVQPGLDEHGVDDGEARRRQRKPANLGLTPRPVERVVRDKGDDAERGKERYEPDRNRRLPFAHELRDVHLRPRLKGQDDPCERADEAQPARDDDVRRVADDDAGEQLDQRDGEPDLDRDGRGEEDRSGQDCC